MTLLRAALSVCLVASSVALGLSSCVSSDTPSDTTSTSSGSSSSGIPDALCLLHNCDTDFECAGCTDGRTHCITAEHRCVACDANDPSSCPSGEKCSSYGNCVPDTLECPTDNGVPTITCNTNADCAACDPAHQICNTAAHKCVACTDSDVSECQTTDTCLGGSCAPKCPATCNSDADCAQCGGPGFEAHVCFNHQCGECSPTKDCDGMMTCGDHGTCEPACGLQGSVKGTCDSDADCMGCEGDATSCHLPINGGHGTCGPNAAGCSDFGTGVVVLPDPWSSVTNLCSNDGDCAGVGIDLNVGKLLRDLTGIDLINDANIEYPMNVCAAVALPGDVSCGLCVPCRVDTDCKNIDIDPVIEDAFGPLGSVAALYLLDQVFGPSEHVVNMYCETIAEGYGVCAPCPGFINGCAIGETPPPGSGSCSHGACTEGEALDPVCDECAASLCTVDPYCCTVGWDAACVASVDLYCSNTCQGQGNEGCSHNECTVGDKLDATCSTCTTDLCDIDPYCCQTTWDQSCVDQLPLYCAGINCQNQGQCTYPNQCWPQGCLWDGTCGPCYADYDCYPKVCNPMTKVCE